MSESQILKLFWSVWEWMYGGGKGDMQVECHKVSVVRIRVPQMCMAYCHSGAHFWRGKVSEAEFRRRRTMPKGTMMVREAAKVDGDFRSCYTCVPCLERAAKESAGE